MHFWNGTIYNNAFLTQLVEYLHGKQKVAGSNPVEGWKITVEHKKLNHI